MKKLLPILLSVILCITLVGGFGLRVRAEEGDNTPTPAPAPTPTVSNDDTSDDDGDETPVPSAVPTEAPEEGDDTLPTPEAVPTPDDEITDDETEDEDLEATPTATPTATPDESDEVSSEISADEVMDRVYQIKSVYQSVKTSDGALERFLTNRVERNDMEANYIDFIDVHTADEASLDMPYIIYEGAEDQYLGAFASLGIILGSYYEGVNGDGAYGDFAAYISERTAEELAFAHLSRDSYEAFSNGELSLGTLPMYDALYVLPYIDSYFSDISVDVGALKTGDDCISEPIDGVSVYFELPLLLDGEDSGILVLLDEDKNLLSFNISGLTVPVRLLPDWELGESDADFSDSASDDADENSKADTASVKSVPLTRAYDYGFTWHYTFDPDTENLEQEALARTAECY